jgi:predicted outer membrane repeat protein
MRTRSILAAAITGVTVTGNRAEGDGGGISALDTRSLRMLDTTITENEALG